MNYQQKKVCKECPYLAQTKGWIGGHTTAMDFHNLVRQDTRMSCHMTRDNGKEQHCVGYAMCKVSRDTKLQKLQKEIRQDRPDNLLFSLDGTEIVNFHSE